MQPGTTISLHMSNVETIPGKTITASLGLVTGSTVRAKHIGKDIFAGLKNIVGGELKAYTELLNESRNEAIQRMMMQAHSMGANGVVNVRFATSNVAAGASELFCYGTAVVVELGFFHGRRPWHCDLVGARGGQHRWLTDHVMGVGTMVSGSTDDSACSQ